MLDTHRDAAPSVQYVAEETVTVARLDDVAAESVRSRAPPVPQGGHPGIRARGSRRGLDHGGPLRGLQLELSFIPLYDGGMLVDEAIGWAYRQGFHLVGIEQGYAAPSGEILQVDGVFVRNAADA